MSNFDIELVKSLPFASYWKNVKGEYTGCNPKMLKLLGYKDEKDILGKKDSQLAWSNFAENLKQSDEYVIINKTTSITQEQLIITGNKKTILLSIKSPLYDINNNLKGIIGVLIDLADKGFDQLNVELISQMIQNDKSLALRQIKHDIKSPITGIISLSQLLKQKYHQKAPHDQMTELMEYLEQASSALGQFLDSLASICEQNFFDAEQNTLFDLNKVASNTIDLMRPFALLKNLSINYSHDESKALLIFSSQDYIMRILTELINNALKYTNTGGVNIVIKELEGPERNAYINITDTGPGMPQDILALLNQSNPSLKAEYKFLGTGNGFGLKMIKAATSILDIDIKAANLTQGSSIDLYIKSNHKNFYN